MRPIRDLIEDRAFVIARLREQGDDLRVLPGYYNQEKPFGMLFCRDRTRVLQVYDRASTFPNKGQVLVVQKFCSNPSDELVLETLAQIEEEHILRRNYRPANAEKRYSLFRMCYQ